jgi:ATP-dependent Clp protease adaptor protein ClpS
MVELTTDTAVAEPTTESQTPLMPQYHIIIENDDVHTMHFVVVVLKTVFGHSFETCFELTYQAHTDGEAVVWTGSKEVAELKVDQVRTFHEKHATTGVSIGPVLCRMEPAT